MQYVVLGATGYIGSYIFRRLNQDCLDAIGTTYRIQSQGAERLVNFDIRNDSIDNFMVEIRDDNRVAIFCIAESNIDFCYENYTQAYEINVIRTKKLIYDLCNNGFRVIFFSTDNVFDGIDGNYIEESPTHAINKYGEMKEEMEHYLLSSELDVCILRLPKVIGEMNVEQNIFTQWISQMEKGCIRCIKHNYLSFIDIEDLYRICLIVSQKRMCGLYNIACGETFRRVDIVKKFFQQLGKNEVDIQECDLKRFSFKDNRPLNIGMSNQKFKYETGYVFRSVEYTIQHYIENFFGGGGN